MALKKSEIAKFKMRLEELRAQMTHFVREASQEVKSNEETRGYSQHQADEGTDDFDRTISLNLTGQEVKVLRQVERALEKIDEGTYGICDVSGEVIPLKRLEAVPYATMTVKAQEEQERET
ncbi:MAG: RNA polymerase-binding transcription factor [Chlamydiae bacterium GWC2_50_10]|nr:MAG: RNA polymerase-binding transcription factor [Chlamydiae bacterium GWA2_50_15]OGN53922.1 MAG: RNA polymerase-binding transcription factor [Chlamydiae bacterium GWC2_50_10]OGN55160.1 MAG: RNA polymerase-binding transcription factor [Chlamydiae bacterium GWF2_49_8]OGN64612.1 MAG: RNA polymerase-binding transcription factor [Chlamydiae bacterium RIFCSPHIGHO2_12_FULL_49_32]OGN68022.1 MAG: RNA polymerase-binding transcription factor [Chlamydiae bacterium RIFCSPLOWO2_02_FULL_49_12]OGN70588.1 